MRICVLGTIATSILEFRKDFILALIKNGHEVYAFSIDYSDVTRNEVIQLGAIPIDYTISRSGLNPIGDIANAIKTSRLIKRIKPDLVFSYFVKPTIFGTLAAVLAGVKRRIAMLEGLGYAFTERTNGFTFKQKLIQRIQVSLYRLSFPFLESLIFLNKDDPIDLVQTHKLKAKNIYVLGGIGLNLSSYPYLATDTKEISFLFIGRLLAEKGIFEYLEAAKLVKKQFPNCRFVVLGGLDESNPGALKQQELHRLLDENVIIYPGHVSNVTEWINRCSVFVLPSYREGFPRSTQEAMAIGRAVLTTDAPGCRETVTDNINGFIVPRWDSHALAEKMVYFINNPEETLRMGNASYLIAKAKFDSNTVNEKLLKLMKL